MDISELEDVSQMELFAEIAASLADHGIVIRLNRNRQTLVSLRHQKDHTLRLSFHFGLLSHRDCIGDLMAFAKTGGRGRYPRLQTAMNAVYRDQFDDLPVAPEAIDNDLIGLPRIGPHFNFEGAFDDIYRQYFGDLPKPGFAWQRNPGRRHLRSIRFGTYYSDRQCVYLNPRLSQPWIAQIFVEHIMHHELCHHRQRHLPIRGETAHSKRFRVWESSFPGFNLARRWEKAYLRHMLADPASLDQGLQEVFLQHDDA